jgi:hypothetical protein
MASITQHSSRVILAFLKVELHTRAGLCCKSSSLQNDANSASSAALDWPSHESGDVHSKHIAISASNDGVPSSRISLPSMLISVGSGRKNGFAENISANRQPNDHTSHFA